jgi:signal transduction histidine kinase
VRYDVTGVALGERQMLVRWSRRCSVHRLAWSDRLVVFARVISPLTELARRVQGLSSRETGELAPHFARDEVGELAAALDDYAARMTALVKRDREFNADVSHELRTPLAVIRGAVETDAGQPDLRRRASSAWTASSAPRGSAPT